MRRVIGTAVLGIVWAAAGAGAADVQVVSVSPPCNLAAPAGMLFEEIETKWSRSSPLRTPDGVEKLLLRAGNAGSKSD